MIRTSDSNPADALREEGQLRFEFLGSSMWPLLKAQRNTVHICYLTQEPQPLDVVLFRRDDGSFVLHRIISACGEIYTLCGDNQIKQEFGITRQQIIGRMAGYYTGERYHSCSAIPYRLYAWLWNRAMPVRRLWVALRGRLRGGKQ